MRPANLVTLDDARSLRELKATLSRGPATCVFEADCTRFDLVLVRLNPERLLVAVTNFGVCWAFYAECDIAPQYVAEKLRFNNPIDPANLAALINCMNRACDSRLTREKKQ